LNFISDCRFAEAVLRAVKGESKVVQPSFVYLPGVPGGEVVQKSVDGLEFFSTNVELGVYFRDL
jgi:malate dehydrogenase